MVPNQSSPFIEQSSRHTMRSWGHQTQADNQLSVLSLQNCLCCPLSGVKSPFQSGSFPVISTDIQIAT